MSEQQENKYEFCPDCGALMRDGVCPECSRKRAKGVYSSRGFGQNPYGQNPDNSALYGQNPDNSALYGQNLNNQYPYGQNPGGFDPRGLNQYPYGQNPGGSNQDFGQNGFYGNYYQPLTPCDKPKKNYVPWIILGVILSIVVLTALLCGSFAYGRYVASQFTSERQEDDWNRGDKGKPDIFAGRDREEKKENDSSKESDYVPSPDDEYYYGPCDFIDESVGYSLELSSYTNEDPEHDVDVLVSYYQIKGGNIPNIDKVNEAIKKISMYYAEEFPQYSLYAEFGESYSAYITPYVTYNDEEILSIVLDEYVQADNEKLIDLCAINVDLKNGVILDNNSLIHIDQKFAGDFRKRNDRQNGSVEYLDSIDDARLCNVLQDKNQAIAYYTPLGMEVGFNYRENGVTGWVTVTYKDYKDYVSSF